MAKSPEAFRTISEVASELEVPQHVLRFWETRFAQIRPLKRGGGRRYYRPDDVELLRGIRTLLYTHGYTIKGVQKILREQGVRYVAGAGWQDSRAASGGALPLGLKDEPKHARARIARVQQVHAPVVLVPAEQRKQT
ncbi:MAG: MerR family transcriptional regulator, partial [Alphaproteobacteria bacterium]|nr:MerR family transcriptional regulator [Alphaproteobacteria bacterium]